MNANTNIYTDKNFAQSVNAIPWAQAVPTLILASPRQLPLYGWVWNLEHCNKRDQMR